MVVKFRLACNLTITFIINNSKTYKTSYKVIKYITEPT